MTTPLSPTERRELEARREAEEPIVGERKVHRIGFERDEAAIASAYELVVQIENEFMPRHLDEWHIKDFLGVHSAWQGPMATEVKAYLRLKLAETELVLGPLKEKLAEARAEWRKLKFGRNT